MKQTTIDRALSGPSDADLLKLVSARDQDALLSLYRRYNLRVFSLILRIVRNRPAAEEILQDTFHTLWESTALFDDSRGLLISWLLTVARNRSLDYVRKTSRRQSFLVWKDEGKTNQQVLSDYTGAALLDPELTHSLRQALEKLPRDQRDAIELAYFEGLSHSELAHRLNASLGTVKSRIRLGLDKLRDVLRRGGMLA